MVYVIVHMFYILEIVISSFLSLFYINWVCSLFQFPKIILLMLLAESFILVQFIVKKFEFLIETDENLNLNNKK